MSNNIQTLLLVAQSFFYFCVWFLYGYGSSALQHRDHWERAQRLYDIHGNEIPLGWTSLDSTMGFVGFGVVMPLPLILALYLILSKFFPALPVPFPKSSLIPFIIALVCLPLGPSIVNGGAFLSKHSPPPEITITKLRELAQSGSPAFCALVSYDQNARKEEMDQCALEVEKAASESDARKSIGRFIRDGKVKKFIQPSHSMNIGRAILEGAIDNWLFLKNFTREPVYQLKADLRELAFFQSRSGYVLTVVPIDRQIWFLNIYSTLLLRDDQTVSSMIGITRLTISMQTGWSDEAKSYFKNSILPQLKAKFMTDLDSVRKLFPEDFNEGSSSWSKTTTDALSNVMTSYW